MLMAQAVGLPRLHADDRPPPTWVSRLRQIHAEIQAASLQASPELNSDGRPRFASDSTSAYGPIHIPDHGAYAWAEENSWYRVGANGKRELVSQSLSKEFKYDTSMDLVNWVQDNEVEFSCSDGVNRTSGNILPRGSLSIVGNGESAAGKGDLIETASEVARFNLFELTNQTGSRTTIHVINAQVDRKQFRAALMLNLECDHPEKGFLPAEGQGTLCFLTQPMRERLCPSDPSRGFLFAAMFHDEDTELFGFDDGLKHYWDPANTPAMFHEMEVEHEVLRDLGWVGP